MDHIYNQCFFSRIEYTDMLILPIRVTIVNQFAKGATFVPIGAC